MNRRGAAVPLAAAAALLLTGGCTSFAADRTPGGSDPVATPSADEPGGPQGISCPVDRAEPDPDRPRMELDFRLEDDRRTVTGCLLYTSPSPRDLSTSRMPSSA